MENEMQLRELELSGLNFSQKPKKHIILTPFRQPNDTQSEKAHHFTSMEAC
ncbi:hypothetical protein [Tuberibacillus calidus]|uniref:hypothetical protein n=1 Tax=Tuberibacillus calidus TaxID=340097 RepID=UPI0012DC94B1|nr:hypothetical protein [Tuberibacillus calidus]